MSDPTALGAAELGAAFAARRLSPVELVRALLDRSSVNQIHIDPVFRGPNALDELLLRMLDEDAAAWHKAASPVRSGWVYTRRNPVGRRPVALTIPRLRSTFGDEPVR